MGEVGGVHIFRGNGTGLNPTLKASASALMTEEYASNEREKKTNEIEINSRLKKSKYC